MQCVDAAAPIHVTHCVVCVRRHTKTAEAIKCHSGEEMTCRTKEPWGPKVAAFSIGRRLQI